MSEKLPPRRLLGIELFNLGLGQDIESGDTKKGTKGEVEQIESHNHHSADAARILIIQELFTTDNHVRGTFQVYKFPNLTNKEGQTRNLKP